MDKTKNNKPEYDEFEGQEVNWAVVLPILLVMAVAIAYIFLF